MISLRGRRALVTGGSRGIGAAAGLLLAEAGADVGIGYRRREADAAAVVRALADRGVRAFAHGADIATEEGVEALFSRVVREFGGLDLFVGSAGVWPENPVALSDMPLDRWRDTMRQNADALFFTARAAARVVADGGRIVLVSSTAAQRGEAMHADYAASKGAMGALVKSLAVELGARGVTVNCIAPGWVDTDMVAGALADGGRERAVGEIPLGRIATARDIAGPIVFLCSDLARHITGEIVNVNGGSVRCG